MRLPVGDTSYGTDLKEGQYLPDVEVTTYNDGEYTVVVVTNDRPEILDLLFFGLDEKGGFVNTGYEDTETYVDPRERKEFRISAPVVAVRWQLYTEEHAPRGTHWQYLGGRKVYNVGLRCPSAQNITPEPRH